MNNQKLNGIGIQAFIMPSSKQKCSLRFQNRFLSVPHASYPCILTTYMPSLYIWRILKVEEDMYIFKAITKDGFRTGLKLIQHNYSTIESIYLTNICNMLSRWMTLFCYSQYCANFLSTKHGCHSCCQQFTNLSFLGWLFDLKCIPPYWVSLCYSFTLHIIP